MGVLLNTTMKKVLSFLTLSVLSFSTFAQQVRPATSSQIYRELNQLNKLVNVLYLAAHPDDENTRMLAWLVNDQYINTAYLSLTRGDGGQNILGPHLGPALGLIRTHELLEARKLDGAKQFFTRAVDFGYSKTADETFNHWDKEQLTSDVVWVMRKFRPDVVICRFPPNEQAGHGQHAASAILAHSAFKVVGDKSRYKDQLQHYPAWQPKRILFNSYRFGSRNTTKADDQQVKVGQYSPLLGMGYGELAGISRSIHRSQGAGTRSVPGVQTEYFTLVDGKPFNNSIFDGIDTTWGRVGREDIGKAINEIINNYNFTQPEASLPALLALHKKIQTVKDDYWRAQKLEELEAIILHCAGFMAELYTDVPEVTQGQEKSFTLNVIARADLPVALKSIDIPNADKDLGTVQLPKDELISKELTIKVSNTQPYTEPYWLSLKQEEYGAYPIPRQTQLGYPNTPNDLVAQLVIDIDGTPISTTVPLSYKTLDATHGDVVEQLRVVPDINLNFTTDMLITNIDGSVTADVHIQTNRVISDGILSIYSKGLKHEVKNINLNANRDTTITVTIPADKIAKLSDKETYLNADLTVGSESFNRQQTTIKYEHLPTLQFYSDAKVKVLRKSWECTAKRIGYIDGAGDDVSELLRLVGLQVDILEAGDINPQNLANYDAVMVGIRALNTKPEMSAWMPVLLEYAKQGGTLVMQYNTAHRLVTKEIGPYPITLSYNRVTEEDADVTILDNSHRLLNYPNKITQEDFSSWVQERGLYFASEWDDRYTPLFSMHDKDEEAQNGSTLYTQYGEGHYIYTPISFFRQLPAGNKGALRLLLNFLSVGK